MRSIIFPLLAVASTIDLAASLAIPETHVLHEKREVIRSSSWEKRDRVASQVTLPVRIGLKQNPEAAEKKVQWLMEMSEPSSEKYGQHWTQEQVNDAFAPTSETLDKVKAWLTTVIDENRITHTDNKAWFAFDATTEELEKLTHAEYYEHHDSLNGRAMLSTDEYYIPKYLQDHIDIITPGVKGIQVKSADLTKRSKGRGSRGPRTHPNGYKPKKHNELDTCDRSITPACLQALYNFKPLNPSTKVSSKNSMGIFEEGDTYAQQDLNLFYKNFTTYIPKGWAPILNSIDGGTAPVKNVADAGGESDLDFSLAIPIIYPQTTTLYQTDDNYYNNDETTNYGLFNTFLDAIDGSYCTYSAYGETGNDPIDPKYPDSHKGGYKGKLQCGTFKPTNVISISYGVQESDFPAYYQKRQCDEYLKLGMQGVSIFVASGDYGVGAAEGCIDGAAGKGTVFSPSQPNGCPWITNVGATKVPLGNTVKDPEVAAYDPPGHPYSDEFASGGGFSNIFTIPDYQKNSVNKYLKEHNPRYPYFTNGEFNKTKGLYNRNGRGIPDVSANGDNIAMYNKGVWSPSGGTSASCPIVAALFTRIIDERIASGKKGPLGFLNPAIYSNPSMFNDITNGTNPGCNTEGFKTAPGWDPVTGLGTPNYPKVSAYFNSLN